MRLLCTICARGGSKGVKNKNLRILDGKPLLAHSILQAKNTDLFEAIAVSSDSEEILKTAKEWGAQYVVQRPQELSTDTAAKVPAIRHCVEQTEKQSGGHFDIIVDLDATSPLRIEEDIHDAVALLKRENVSNVITGVPAHRSPYFNMVEEDARGFVHLCKRPGKPVVRRQDSPACFDLNASIYVWKREALDRHDSVFLEDTKLFVMPQERSWDIDSELDFEITEFLWKKTRTTKKFSR